MANQTGGTQKKGCCLGCALVFAGGLFLILLLLVAAILFWDDEESSVSTESSVLTISDIAGSTEASVPFTPAENADNYYYQLLSESEQSSYQKMLPEMEQHLEKFDWSWSFWDGTDGDAAIALLDSIYADNPEMFWLSAYQFSQVGTSYRFEYWISESDIVSELAQVQAAAAPIIAQAKQIPQEYDRALYLYQTVIERIDYEDVADEESAESNRKRSVLGGLIDGKAVCAGYAKTFQYLANASGIRCTYVTGTSRSVGHAWNLIWIDGQPYYCDPTWGDSAVNDGMEYTDYFYFCMTQDELFRTHEIETPALYCNRCLLLSQKRLVSGLLRLRLCQQSAAKPERGGNAAADHPVWFGGTAASGGHRPCRGGHDFRGVLGHSILLLLGGSQNLYFAHCSEIIQKSQPVGRISL